MDMALVRLSNSSILSCSAENRRGGALYLQSGVVQLTDRSLLRGNNAALGASVWVEDGFVTYRLPAPAGHYIAGQQCRVYYKPCPISRPNCAADPNREVSEIQPCDWINQPELLGHVVETLGAGSRDIEWPLPWCVRQIRVAPARNAGPDAGSDAGFGACIAMQGRTDACMFAPCHSNRGVLGGMNASDQGSSLCAGPCPSGSLCREAATVLPTACPPSFYCEAGSAEPVPWCAPRKNEPRLTWPHRASN